MRSDLFIRSSFQTRLFRLTGSVVMTMVMTLFYGCASTKTQPLAPPEQPASLAQSLPHTSTADQNIAPAISGEEISLKDENLAADEEDDPYADEYNDEDEYGDTDAQTLVADPLEPFNRWMFTFNDKLYYWLLKPTSTVYASIFPHQFRQGIDNFFDNLEFPIRFVSNILQLKFDKAVTEVGCFAVNTTFGMGGLVNISDHIEPLKDVPPEDLGQTLAHYGVGDGFYIVWPLIGPSTLRDSTGKVGEYFLDPTLYSIHDWEISVGIKAEQITNYTSLHQGDYEDLKEAAFDPYEALKDFYIQHRQHMIRK